MNKAIPNSRNITKYLLDHPKDPFETWRLKSSIGGINGVFHIQHKSLSHPTYTLKIELDIFPDGDAYFFDPDHDKGQETKGRQEKLEKMLEHSIKPTIKTWVQLRKSGLMVHTLKDKTVDGTNVFEIVKKILEFVATDDVVRSMDINLRKSLDKDH